MKAIIAASKLCLAASYLIFSTQPANATESCGGYSSTGNPNLCCTDDYDKNPKTSLAESEQGNCVWWAWKMAKEYYNVSLYSRSARYWAGSAKSDGYAVSYTPIANTVAVWEGGDYGHVAWINSVSESTVNASEMNCKFNSKALGTTARDKSYTNFFSRYILPSIQISKIEIQDDQKIKADATATAKTPNFSVTFSLKNPSSKDVSIDTLVMSLQKYNKDKWEDVDDMRDECSGLPKTLKNVNLSSGKIMDEIKVTAPIASIGKYRVVPRVQVGSAWFEVGNGVEFDVNSTAEYPGQDAYACKLGTLSFDGEMGCVGYEVNTVFTNLLADLSEDQGIYQIKGEAKTKNKASDINFYATSKLNGNYDASTHATTFDIQMIRLSDGKHYRTDQCKGNWGATGLNVSQCTLTYNNGAGCKLWFKLRLSK